MVVRISLYHNKNDKPNTVAVLFVLLVSSATIYDFNMKEKSNSNRPLSHMVIMAFSARKNFNELSRVDETNRALSFLYGLRTLAIFAIIIGHRFALTQHITNFDYTDQLFRSTTQCLLLQSDLFVDTFFMMSGMLVTYLLMVYHDKKHVNPAFTICLRYTRLTPVYAFVLFYQSTVLSYFGSGPLWKPIMVDAEIADCRKNWWTNLLYVNNYVNDDHMCNIPAWYLACDFHYFIIATLLIALMRKNKKLAIGLYLLLSLLSLAVPFVLTIIYSRTAMVRFVYMLLETVKTNSDFRFYTKSHNRASSYFIGMLAGYIYYKLKDGGSKLSKMKSHALTFVSICLIFVCMTSGTVFYNPYHRYDALESAIYAALRRPTWALGSIGLIITASYGHNTILQKILSWSPFVPLSKLVYGAFLIHISFIFRTSGMVGGPQYFDYFNLVGVGTGDIVVSFIASLILYIVVEAPMRNLFSELLGPSRTPAIVSETAAKDPVAILTNISCSSKL